MLIRHRLHLGIAMASTFIGLQWSSLVGAAEWRAMRVRVNGITIDLRTTESDLPREEIVRRVMAAWMAQGAVQPARLVSSERTIIGRQRGVIHETVSIRTNAASGRVQIEYAAQDLTRARVTAARPPFVVPMGLRILQVTEFLDDPRTERQFVLQMRRAPSVAAASLREALRRSAWSVGTRELRARGGAGGFVLSGERAGERLEATVRAEEDGARIVLLVGGRAQ